MQPDFASFARAYDSGRPQAIYTRLIADLETPVSAFLKLAEGRDNAFLLESVQGGETRGRYSIIGLRPDLIWRCQGATAEINRQALNKDSFSPLKEKPLDSLRALIAETKMALPEGLPPMAVGLFGYLGYDMVRQMEKLPNMPPDRLGLPDAILLRPTITACSMEATSFGSVASGTFAVASIATMARWAFRLASRAISAPSISELME